MKYLLLQVSKAIHPEMKDEERTGSYLVWLFFVVFVPVIAVVGGLVYWLLK